MKKLSQVKTGIALSYILLVANALYGIFLTPFIISHLGVGQYGVYKTIASLSASLLVIDLGIGGTVQRFIAKYRADEELNKISNFLAMSFIQAIILSGVISCVFFGAFFAIEPLYGAKFSIGELTIAKVMFVIMAINMAFQIFSNVIDGIVTGYNQFIFANGMKLIKLVLRIALIVVLLIQFESAYVLVCIDLVLSVVGIAAQLFYIKKGLNVRIKLDRWDKSVFLEMGKYTLLMFLTTIVTQINSNLDNIVIGALSGPTFVTVYSIGLLFFGMFQNISSAVSGVMLPTITNILAKKDSDDQLISVIIKIGRFQFLFLGAAVIGFLCIGKDFVNVWLGEGYNDVYIITLLLIIPSLFELCINVCLSILRAQNRLGFRTIVIFAGAVVNLIITVFLVKYWSYIGAAIGTAISYVACSLITMNLYYSKKLGLPMLKIYKSIVSKIWVCMLIAAVALLVSSRYMYGSYVAIMINIIIFCIVYGSTLLLFGLSKNEKKRIPLVNKYVR